MEKQEAFEVAISVHSVTNARHDCGDGRSRPVQPPEEGYCGYCGGPLGKRIDLRVNIRMPNTDDLKSFLVSDLAIKIRNLVEEEIAIYLATGRDP